MHTSRRVLLVRQAACVAAVLGLFLAILSSAARAQTASWAGGDAGGNWSVTTNWDPAGNPTAGQTATLGNVITGTRKVVYNTGANSGTLGSLVLTQTSAAVNELEVQRSLSITGGVTLGAAGGGTSRLFLDPAAAGASFTTTFSGGLTINAGGELRVRAVNLSGGTSLVNAQISGNVTVSGGSLIVAPLLKNGTNTGASQNDITGTLTMSSGTILLDNVNVSGESDRRLRVTGNVAITGGDIMANVAGAKLMLTGGSRTERVNDFETPAEQIYCRGVAPVCGLAADSRAG